MNVQRRRNSRGFVFLTAVLILGIVGAALLALAETASSEARTTGSRVVRAQLVQLLLAGAADAQSRLQTPIEPGQTWKVATPDSLAGATLSTLVESASADSAVLRISAAMDRSHLDQVIELKRKEKGWQIMSASLEPHWSSPIGYIH